MLLPPGAEEYSGNRPASIIIQERVHGTIQSNSEFLKWSSSSPGLFYHLLLQLNNVELRLNTHSKQKWERKQRVSVILAQACPVWSVDKISENQNNVWETVKKTRENGTEKHSGGRQRHGRLHGRAILPMGKNLRLYISRPITLGILKFQLRGFPEAPKRLSFEDLTNGVFLHNILQNL